MSPKQDPKSHKRLSMMFKSVVRSLLRAVGYEIRRASTDRLASDPFDIQKKLLTGVNTLTIFDVGAHHGQTAEKYALTFPESTIYSFEPFHDSFKVLEKLALTYTIIKPYCFAVADSPGRRAFHISQMSATHSLLPRPRNLRRYYPRDAEMVGQVEVETTTLDILCQQLSISKIDILKMDIQGGELLALKGASDLLSKSRIGLIYTEVMFVPHYEGGPMFYELGEFLARYDYSLYDLFLVKHGTNGQLRYGDAIFISYEMRTRVVDSFDPEA